MSTSSYRLIVVVCAVSWFLTGIHTPILQGIAHHGHAPRVGVLGMVALIAVIAVVALIALLRTPARARQ